MTIQPVSTEPICAMRALDEGHEFGERRSDVVGFIWEQLWRSHSKIAIVSSIV